MIGRLSEGWALSAGLVWLASGILVTWILSGLAKIGGIVNVALGLTLISVVVFKRLAMWFKRARERERQEQGRCRHCGYSLTGNVSGTCPECGELVEEADSPITRADEDWVGDS